MRNRRGERGFILITVLVLMSVLMGIAMSMLDTVDNNVQVVNYAKRAAYARLAAMSAFNYAAAYLVRDANGGDLYNPVDALNEDWHMKTHTAGVDAPYTAFTSGYTNGYFVNIVYDLSARIPSNSTNVRCTALIRASVGNGACATMTANIEKTIGEIDEQGPTPSDLYAFTPYASISGYRINLNTVGQLGDGANADDVTAAIQSAGGQTTTGNQRLIAFRRTALSGTGLALSTGPALSDYAINTTRIFSEYPVPTAALRVMFSAGNLNLGVYTTYGTISSEGYFLIHSKGFLSSAAAGANHLAENRIMSVVKRTATGFTTLYFRWFWDDSQVKLAAP